MTYHHNKKARKLWSDQAVAAKERDRLAAAGEFAPFIDIDPTIKITIERPGTGERAEFECTKGTRIDNYRV